MVQSLSQFWHTFSLFTKFHRQSPGRGCTPTTAWNWRARRDYPPKGTSKYIVPKDPPSNEQTTPSINSTKLRTVVSSETHVVHNKVQITEDHHSGIPNSPTPSAHSRLSQSSEQATVTGTVTTSNKPYSPTTILR